MFCCEMFYVRIDGNTGSKKLMELQAHRLKEFKIFIYIVIS